MYNNKNNIIFLVAFSKGGKVIELKRVVTSNVSLLREFTQQRYSGCCVEIYELPQIDQKHTITNNVIKGTIKAPHPNGKGVNKIRCIDTGEIYDSVEEAGVAMNIPNASIYESIRRHIRARGKYFEYVV